MIYTRDDAEVLDDPIAFVRNHRQLFLGQVTGEDLAMNLVRGTLLLTNGPVTVCREDRWWLVAAESDWMVACAGATVEDIFKRMIPFPQAGPNSIRPEVLLTAFAASVATWDRGGVCVIKGNVSAKDAVWRVVTSHPLWKRVVVFRPEEQR